MRPFSNKQKLLNKIICFNFLRNYNCVQNYYLKSFFFHLQKYFLLLEYHIGLLGHLLDQYRGQLIIYMTCLKCFGFFQWSQYLTLFFIFFYPSLLAASLICKLGPASHMERICDDYHKIIFSGNVTMLLILLTHLHLESVLSHYNAHSFLLPPSSLMFFLHSLHD